MGHDEVHLANTKINQKYDIFLTDAELILFFIVQVHGTSLKNFFVLSDNTTFLMFQAKKTVSKKNRDSDENFAFVSFL